MLLSETIEVLEPAPGFAPNSADPGGETHLARSFRFYQKKRGNRRTGSEKLGTAGEALFFAVFFLLGCAGLVVMLTTLAVPEWRANHEFARETCTVRQTRIGEKPGDNAALYRPEVQIEYQVEGETYRIWTYNIHTIRDGGYSTGQDDAQAVLEDFVPGEQYSVYYNPSDPTEAVLVRGSSWWVWLSFLVPISFILIGGGGLLLRIFTWGKSTERRAALARQAAMIGGLTADGGAEPGFPYVPVAANVTDSPGTKLAFRLPVAGSVAGALFVWLVVCLLWNGIVSVFVVIVIGSFLAGDPNWFLTFFMSPFVLIGIGLIVVFLRQLVVATGIGPTLLEISEQPLYPGQQCRVFLSQTGRLKMNWLELLLVCDEETTYRQGTDTRTETQRVYEEPFVRREQLEVAGGAPFETECEVTVPAGAMHSFKSGHNEVAWKILVRGSPARWPDFERSFRVIVYPGRNGKGDA